MLKALLSKQLAGQAATIITSKFVVFLLSFGLMAALANLLPKETVGIYNYLIAATAIISITTLPGMNTALISSVAKGSEGSYRAMTRKRIRYGLIGSVIAFIFSLWYFAHANETLGRLFVITALFLPLTDTINESAVYYWIGKKEYRKSAWVSVAYQFLYTTPSILILFITKRIEYVLLSFLFFQAIAGYILYRTITPKNTATDKASEWFGMHLTLMNAFRTIGLHADKIIVWQLLGPAVLAAYTIATTPLLKLEQLIPIEILALPRLAETTGTQELKQKLLRKAGAFFLLLLPVVALGYFLAPFVYHILFPTFTESIPMFRILLLTLLAMPFILLRTGLVAWQEKQALYILETAAPLFKITLCIVCGILFGLQGLLFGIVGAKALEGLLTLILFLRI